MLVHFRKRISPDMLAKVNERISLSDQRSPLTQKKSAPHSVELRGGKILLATTAAPGDITYPSDLKLLNSARKGTEKAIDKLHQKLVGKEKKVRTYRQIASRLFKNLSKKNRKTHKKLRKELKQQLNSIRRNLHKKLFPVHEVYSQQMAMYQTHTRRISDRIVNISQPHIKPIVRGKS